MPRQDVQMRVCVYARACVCVRTCSGQNSSYSAGSLGKLTKVTPSCGGWHHLGPVLIWAQ